MRVGFPNGSAGEESICNTEATGDCGFDPQVRKIACSRKWQPTPTFLPGKSYGPKSLAGYSPKGHKESDMTERLSTYAHTHMHTHAHKCGCSFLTTIHFEYLLRIKSDSDGIQKKLTKRGRKIECFKRVVLFFSPWYKQMLNYSFLLAKGQNGKLERNFVKNRKLSREHFSPHAIQYFPSPTFLGYV